MELSSIELDPIDRSIIAELQRDGRMSYAELGPIVGLSAAAVRPRVQRLIESGLVRVVGVTDPQAMGYPTMAMLGIQVDSDTRVVADQIADVPGVIYVVFSSGEFDLLVEVICVDPQDLLNVVNAHVKAIAGVRRVESFMYLGIHTHRFGWDPKVPS